MIYAVLMSALSTTCIVVGLYLVGAFELFRRKQRHSRMGTSDSSRGRDRTPGLEPPQSSRFAALLYAALFSVLVGSCLIVGFYQIEAQAQQPYRSA
ncbi:hypothetical protein MTO96_040640 [Rhipicephalus appendiculatus]